MLNIGSSIFVLNSSAKHSGASTRKGSLGFATAKGRIFFLKFEEEQVEVAVDVTKILFTRYGFEEQSRREIKTFLNVVPVFPKWEEDSEKKITDFIEKFDADKFESDQWAQLREYMMVPHSTPIGMLVPIVGQPMNLEGMGEKALTTWFDCYLRSDTVHSLLNEMSVTEGSYLQQTSHTYINILREMINSRERKESLLHTLAGGDVHRTNTIDVLRKIVLTASAKDNHKALAQLNERLRDGVDMTAFEDKGGFIQEMMYDYYTPTFNKRIHLVEKYGDKSMRDLVQCLLKTRDVLTSLATGGRGVVVGLPLKTGV